VTSELTHVDENGIARMVDVAEKSPTHRRAIARCEVRMAPQTMALVKSNSISKGDVLGVARIAGIQAAKQTANLIPLCHPLLITAVHVEFTLSNDQGENVVGIEATAEVIDRTGVEMEALTACAVAALTIYDMCKGVDKTMVIEGLALWEKTGGRSGVYRRQS
jgi:cyclic pyranopterin monophosphate synthase